MTSPTAKEMRLQVTALHPEAIDILSLTLADPDGLALPPAGPGAHITLRLAEKLVRQYSLYNGPGEKRHYHIAVKREADSRGGSEAVHRLRVGDIVRVAPPDNKFPLDRSARHLVLLAGGIGITPLLSMAKDARRRGQSFELHYFARTPQHAAFHDFLASHVFASHVQFHFGVEADAVGARMDALLRGAPTGSQLYVCGPNAFIDRARSVAASCQALSAVHWESFTAEPGSRPAAEATSGFAVRLARTGKTLRVDPGKTILQVLQENGVAVDCSCMEGVCGLCITRVLEGEPEHRDEVLSDEERRSGDLMTVCVSGCKGDLLVLDI
ncbi:PDR/VanB family oxidoreductase [Rhodospirillaceae bacterium SYSU D60014]|uniref:PDR/VanB family oxidoreductase n=1 Tax=Virgifigura deserti TaxID=2268457 RepID=UPI000E6702F8